MKPPLTDALLDRIAARFRVLSEPARLKILRRLLQSETSVGEIAEAAGLSQANTSKHLGVLLAARFVKRRARGNVVYYSVDDPTLPELCKVACDGYAAMMAAEAKVLKSKN